MASNYTSNYGLCQWDPEDKVVRTDFNADNARIDAAIHNVETLKADRSALAALALRVDGKADQSALDSLSGTVSGHSGTLSKKGNCEIEYQTYTGNGRYGSSGSTSRSFSGKPLLVVFSGGGNMIIAPYGVGAVYVEAGSSSQALTASWGGSSVSLNSVSSALAQMNGQGVAYSVIAFISKG